jgi:hypothetical protein
MRMRVPDGRAPSCREYCSPDSGRSSALHTGTSQPELLLTDAMHQLDAGNRDCRVTELLEANHRGDALLDAPVVLLNQVVQIF